MFDYVDAQAQGGCDHANGYLVCNIDMQTYSDGTCRICTHAPGAVLSYGSGKSILCLGSGKSIYFHSNGRIAGCYTRGVIDTVSGERCVGVQRVSFDSSGNLTGCDEE